ncbi:MAG: AraC family transcriptional regulator [Propionibacteriaceae bacterium]|nr:MAG: AraC family transcriptional regulator [Propionibacteriaceae bacterium]
MSDTTSPTYAVVHRPARPAVTVTRTVTMATLHEMADAVPPLLDWLTAHGRVPAGPPFLRYLVIDMAADMVVQAGVPVDTPVEGDEHVKPDELPAGDYLTTVHVGPYEGLYGATGALLAYAGRQGLKLDHHPSDAGDVWVSRLEWYETDPLVEPDPARWTTRLEMKLA